MQDWQARLTATGCRITQPRREIMGVLERAPGPLTPPEILAQAQATCPHLGLVTVYRALTLFAELGLVRRIHHGEGCHGYLLASPGHHHALVCHGCGRAVEFAGCQEIDALIKRLQQQTGFAIDEHLLQLFGLCAACLAAQDLVDDEAP